MTIRTRVHTAHDASQCWSRLVDDLVSSLASRGVLGCSGVHAALLDLNLAVTSAQPHRGPTGRPRTDESAARDAGAP